jgi:hypothetical protein
MELAIDIETLGYFPLSLLEIDVRDNPRKQPNGIEDAVGHSRHSLCQNGSVRNP